MHGGSRTCVTQMCLPQCVPCTERITRNILHASKLLQQRLVAHHRTTFSSTISELIVLSARHIHRDTYKASESFLDCFPVKVAFRDSSLLSVEALSELCRWL